MRVGTSFAIYDSYAVDRDHPHACGDKVPSPFIIKKA